MDKKIYFIASVKIVGSDYLPSSKNILDKLVFASSIGFRGFEKMKENQTQETKYRASLVCVSQNLNLEYLNGHQSERNIRSVEMPRTNMPS